MAYMTRIPSDLARFGLKVELVPGWETRGSSSFAPACVVDHWTAGPRGTSGRPSLSVVVNGRAGLDGPLANVYLARDGVCVVVAAGRANHAGTGGFRGLVGNSSAYGIEAESGGDGDWTPEMLDAYPRLNAALLYGLGRDASWLCGHNEWTPRKIDIRDIIGTVRAQTAAVLTNPNASQGDDFVMDAEARKEFAELRRLEALGVGVQIGDARGPGEKTPGEQVFERTLVNEFGKPEQFANLISRLNIDLRNDLQFKGQQITALVAANGALTQLVAQQNGLTVADVEAAVTRAVAKGVDVDVNVRAS